MKRILLTLSLSVLLISSCSKHDDPELPKTGVQFRFSDFSWEIGELGKSRAASVSGEQEYNTGDTLRNHAKFFYYRAYNASGVKVSEKMQTSEAADFGLVSDALNPGTYTVVFIASNKALGLSGYGFDKDHCYIADNSYWEDTFFRKFTIQVGGEPVSHAVSMERIVGALEVTLLDATPLNASKIILSAAYEVGVYGFASGSRTATATKTKEFILTDTEKGAKNRKFLMHILNTNRPLDITITSYNDQNLVLASKTISGVSFQQNRKTSLSGYLSSSSVFTVIVDPVWGTPLAPIGF